MLLTTFHYFQTAISDQYITYFSFAFISIIAAECVLAILLLSLIIKTLFIANGNNNLETLQV